MTDSIQKIVSGFLSGMLAAFLFHQSMVLLLKMSGILPEAAPWSWAPGPHPFMPAIVLTCLWGGLWGTIITLAWDDMPGDSLPMRGAAAGVLGPGVIGGWIIVPWMSGEPLFSGGDVKKIAISAALYASYGVGVALFHFLLEKRQAKRPERRRVLI